MSAPPALEGRRVTVMGLGLFGGGAAVARFAATRGARVTVTDLRTEVELARGLEAVRGLDLRLVLGRHEPDDFRSADLVVVNPAVPPTSRYLRVAREGGARLTSEAALFLDHVPARVAAVTGTQGKSSTCNLLAGVLAGAGVRSWLGGNIGRSLLGELEDMSPEDVVVLELSSYQLQSLADEVSRERASSPVELVAITNVLADHLERHGSREAYGAAKARILELARPGSPALLPAGEALLREVDLQGCRRVDAHGGAPSATGLTWRDGAFLLDGEELAPLASLCLDGEFQRENALLALGAARLLGADQARLGDALRAVGGLPHRLAPLGTIAGHRVWDNAVSTTPDSTVSAMRSLSPGFTLLVGGEVKDLPIAELLLVARERARRVIVFGAARAAWVAPFREAGVETLAAASVPQAVRTAFRVLEAGAELLFSPAAASFDAYSNFEGRAEDFRASLAEVPVRERT